MALFKIFRGQETELNDVPNHEGYAYFCQDTGNMFIDIGNGDSATHKGDRVQVNAFYANALRKIDSDGTVTEIDIDDLVLSTATIAVDKGGTGRQTLTVNAIIVGDGTNQVKMISIADGDVVVGDADDGVKGVNGTGAFYALVAGAPQFGTLPLSVGGTGGTDAATARTNLEVYSKTEVDEKIDKATTLSYATTLLKDGWIASGNVFTYTYTNPDLKCGKNGNVPPDITWTSNQGEYSKIDSAEGVAGSGITFTIKEKPTADIGIIIRDIG